MLSLAACTMALAMALGTPSTPLDAPALLESPNRHVRTTDESMRRLLKDGFQRSPTFASLMRRLQLSDVYVYVQEVNRLPGGLDGRLVVLPPTHGVRYVRIQVALRSTPNDSIAVLGHELRHAVEVADAPNVLDAEGLAALYRRIGITRGDNEFDTVAAQETGRRVARELAA